MPPSEVDRADRATPLVLTVALVMRLVLFALAQGVIAALLAWGGTPDPWGASAAGWPICWTSGRGWTWRGRGGRGRS